MAQLGGYYVVFVFICQSDRCIITQKILMNYENHHDDRVNSLTD